VIDQKEGVSLKATKPATVSSTYFAVAFTTTSEIDKLSVYDISLKFLNPI